MCIPPGLELSVSTSLLPQLQALLGSSAVLTTEADLAPHVTDWRGRYHGNAACVVLPSSAEQVAAVVRACAEHGVPIVPQGGNTSLCEGAVPRSGPISSVVVNLQRMRRVRSVDIANNSIEVEAGCVLASVQQEAAALGRLYQVSLGAEGSCQIGGNVATNAGGTGVLRYGNTRENVLGLEVVLPDGRIWDGLYCLRKNNTGPDLKHLFIGSEGTLGVITAATLRLHPLPTAHAAAWMAHGSPQAALSMLGRFQQRCGGVLSAYEMMNDVELKIVLDNVPGQRDPLGESYPWYVLVELADTCGEEALGAVLQDVIAEGLENGDVANAAIAVSGQQRADFWQVRHSVSEGNKKAGMGINTDCAVPVSAVPEFIRRATSATHSILPGVPIIVVAHLGDGNVHFIPLASFEQWRSFSDAEAVSHRVKHAVNEVAHQLRGTFSAEHGIGQQLMQEMNEFKPRVEVDMMRGIKRLLDPYNLFNPGRLLPPAA
ncbi:MAG: FAD-binding oxidoreductase [Caldimonas sp.]